MKKIKFDEATKKKAGEIWCQRSYDEMIDFLADVVNRQLEEGGSQPLVKGTDNQHGTIEFDEVGYWRKKFDDVLIRAEKAEAAMEAVRALIERDLVINSANQWEAGYTAAMRNIADAAGFTIVPAQPLKVIRHD